MAEVGLLKIEDPKVDGESKVDGHEKEIEVLSYSFGGGNSGGSQAGTGLSTGTTAFQDFSITKYVDSSSSKLFELICKGQLIKKAQFQFLRGGEQGGGYVPYYTYHFTDVVIANIQTSGSGGDDKPMESISFSIAGKVVQDYRVQKTDGTSATISAGYDIKTGVPTERV